MDVTAYDLNGIRTYEVNGVTWYNLSDVCQKFSIPEEIFNADFFVEINARRSEIVQNSNSIIFIRYGVLDKILRLDEDEEDESL